MIPRETIDRIFTSARVEEVVGDFVNLKKRGVNYIGLCPFHNEKTPSFNVNPARGIYKCFGCGKGGNAVNFVMEHEKMDYVSALKYLARKYNIEIVEEEETAEVVQERRDRESIEMACKFAAKFFSEQLQTETGKAIGLSYFEERGFSPQTIEKFQLGYSPENPKALLDTALKAGYNLKYLIGAGLIINPEESGEINPGRCYDRYHGRVIFPIQGTSGIVIAFGGRTLKQDKKIAKYVNSPEGILYNKSQVLYGLYLARKAIVAEDTCLLVEGYADVISMHQAGVENVVASSGTSLTVEQVRLIRRYTSNLTILYDGDSAGLKAAERGLNIALEEGMDVRIVTLPPEDDPDTFARKHSLEEIKEYLQKNSRDLITYRSKNVAAQTVDPVQKWNFIKSILQSIAHIQNKVKLNAYIENCAREFDVKEDALRSELAKIYLDLKEKNKRDENNFQRQNNIATSATEEKSKKETAAFDVFSSGPYEKELLRVLIKYGNEDATFHGEDQDNGEAPEKIKMKVADFIIQILQADNITFDVPVYGQMYTDYLTAYEKGFYLTEDTYLHHREPKINEVAVDLFVETYQIYDWSKRSIGIKSEKDNLGLTTEKAVYGLMSRKIELLIRQYQENLRHPLNEEELANMMSYKKRLDDAKRHFNKKLGRVM